MQSTGCTVLNTSAGVASCAIDSTTNSPVYGTSLLGGAIGIIGILGAPNSTISITDTTASGNVTSNLAGPVYIGGFLGQLISSTTTTASAVTLQRLTASGNVTGLSTTSTTSGAGSQYMGGFVGSMQLNTTIANLSSTFSRLGATGNVTGGDASAGTAASSGIFILLPIRVLFQR